MTRRQCGARASRNGHGATDEQVRRLEHQVEHLSEALSRALRTKQKALPPGMGQPDLNPDDPYALYGGMLLAEHDGHPEKALTFALDLCVRASAHPLCSAAARKAAKTRARKTS